VANNAINTCSNIIMKVSSESPAPKCKFECLHIRFHASVPKIWLFLCMILKGQQRMVPKVDLGEWAIALLGTGTCPCRKAANVNVNHHFTC
jgi:hypothetical protein